jgi:hypothetical protein
VIRTSILAGLALLLAPPASAEEPQPTFAALADPVRRELQSKQDAQFDAWQTIAQHSQRSICENLCRDGVHPWPTQPRDPFARLYDGTGTPPERLQAPVRKAAVRSVQVDGDVPLLVFDRRRLTLKITFARPE